MGRSWRTERNDVMKVLCENPDYSRPGRGAGSPPHARNSLKGKGPVCWSRKPREVNREQSLRHDDFAHLCPHRPGSMTPDTDSSSLISPVRMQLM